MMRVLKAALFFLLAGFHGLVVGTSIGGAFFVPAGSGLAGPAIALGYGVVGLVGAIVLGVIGVRRLSQPAIARITLGMGVVAVVVAVWLTLRVRTNSAPPPPADRPVTNTGLHADVPRAAAPLFGIGIVKPRLAAGTALHFYGMPDVEQLPYETLPVDSLTFVAGTHYVDIGYAPPWFVPEYMKLDYDILHLRAVTLSRNWVEVVVNRQTERRAWVAREAVEVRLWSDFLLDVAAVESLDPSGNPVRLKPVDEAGVLADATLPLRPLAVQGEWLLVSTEGLADRIPPTGWLRWRAGDRMLIRYALLS